MNYLYKFFGCVIFLLSGMDISAQVMPCPPNIDFEQGTFSNWVYTKGLNYGLNRTWSNPSVPSPTRTQLITNTAALDPICGIPILAPNGGLYSVKLGNDSNGREMDRLSYTFTIPAGVNNYNVIYRYAVVFQDPQGHYDYEKPFFSVIAYNAANNLPIACDSSLYVASSNLPGFTETSPGSSIWYKDWSTTSLKLAGMAGMTIRLEFTASDCALGAHFGYGYIDVTCGLFKITSANCNSAPTTPLTAPPGFQSYIWYNNNYTSAIGSGQTITIPTPAVSSDYHVVITPYPGFGCVDTLTTRVVFSNLIANVMPDSASLCTTSSVQINTSVTGNATPFSYNWAPTVGLTCAFCPNPTASPTTTTTYVLSVTDTVGCTVYDSVKIIAPVQINETHTNIQCSGQKTGSAQIVPAGGVPPYTIVWNTAPAQFGTSINNLAAGTYNVTVTDAQNCTSTKSITITQPPALTATVTGPPVRCNGVGTTYAAISATGGTQPYVYIWNTTPQQINDTAINLPGGTYTCTVSDAAGCSEIISYTVPQSNPLVVSVNLLNKSCPGEHNSRAIALISGATGSVNYQWNTTPVTTTALLANVGMGTYIVTVKDSVGCIGADTISIPDFIAPTVSAGNDVEICAGETTTLTAQGAVNYTWQPPATLSCTGCVSPAATPLTTTRYTVMGVDSNGCSDTAYVTVHVIERVAVDVDSAHRICLGDKVMLQAMGGVGYEWTPAESLLGPFLPNPVASPGATTNYRVIITENRCFADTLYQLVTVMPLPSIDIMNGFSGIPGATVTLNTTVAAAQTIAWSPPRGLSCYDCFAPVATLDKTIIYVAEVTDSVGCKARDTIQIIVGCNGDPFYMANTFTPNKDGRNDYFYPQGFGVNMVNRFMVYNRWGEVVFSGANIPVNEPERGWDGMYKGKEVPPDVFVYVIEAICTDGTPIVVKGDVTLVR